MQRLNAALASHPRLLEAARTALAAFLPHVVVPIVMGQLRRLQRAEFTVAMHALADSLRLDAAATAEIYNARCNAIYSMVLALCMHEEPAIRYLRHYPRVTRAITANLDDLIQIARDRNASNRQRLRVAGLARLRRGWALALARA